jgi:hypothetical protein
MNIFKAIHITTVACSWYLRMMLLFKASVRNTNSSSLSLMKLQLSLVMASEYTA